MITCGFLLSLYPWSAYILRKLIKQASHIRLGESCFHFHYISVFSAVHIPTVVFLPPFHKSVDLSNAFSRQHHKIYNGKHLLGGPWHIISWFLRYMPPNCLSIIMRVWCFLVAFLTRFTGKNWAERWKSKWGRKKYRKVQYRSESWNEWYDCVGMLPYFLKFCCTFNNEVAIKFHACCSCRTFLYSWKLSWSFARAWASSLEWFCWLMPASFPSNRELSAGDFDIGDGNAMRDNMSVHQQIR